jgi:hypothetical protein
VITDITHDVSTPIIAGRVLANGVVVAEDANDALNPLSDLAIPGRTIGGEGSIAARCGQTYVLELFAQASDDVDFKSIATTKGIPFPLSIP